MSKRPYFPIYHEDMEAFAHLSDRDLGIILRLLYRASVGEEPEVPRRLLSEYNSMVRKVKKDAEAYEKKVEQATKASHARKGKASDDNGRYRTMSDELQPNLTQPNLTQHNNNPPLRMLQRNDDMSDVMSDI